ncbi:MAG: TonB-dependent receptor, partial [candidate division Zixibacteria bacterium]|nr:TonB-dependent receptor [candidate division Zixibacteria bacterium]
MDINFREGNRDEFDAQLDLNFAGFGGVVETPLFNQKGSLLFSARRSYLDLLIDLADVGTTVAPRYGDYQGKLVYDLNPHHRLTLLAVSGDDHNNPDRETARENAMIVYGTQDIYENTAGINWRALWNKSGYSNTSVSFTSDKFTEDYYETSSAIHLLRNRSLEQSFKFRNVNHFRLSQRHSIEFGVEAKHLITDYDNFFNDYTDALGDTVPAFTIKDEITANKAGLFVSYIAKPVKRLTTTLGMRGDYFSYNENSYLSPRFSFSYQLTPRTSFNGATGFFY